MYPLFRKKSRLLSVVSLVLLAQCCCCILPIRWEVQRREPTARALIERVEARLWIDIPFEILLSRR